MNPFNFEAAKQRAPEPKRRFSALASALGWLLLAASPAASAPAAGPEAARTVSLKVGPKDVIPTGNDWIALPSIRASDGAIKEFNVIAMRYRGLVEAAGADGGPLIAPFLERDGERRPLSDLSWTLRDYWIPTATMERDGVRLRVTYVAPPESRAAIIRFQVENLTDHPVRVAPGLEVNWGETRRVTYSPERLKGAMFTSPTPIDTEMEIFNYGTDDTHFAWGLAHVGSEGTVRSGPTPGLTTRRPTELAPHGRLDLHFIIGVGLEEYSAAYAMRVLNKRIYRYGLDGVMDEAARQAHMRTRTTGRADLDMIMNRNFLFTTYYAWGRALDTEELVGVTSRSNRYYVSAAYWDRDALLWSFPALLDIDPQRARGALDYALGVQARNAGVHSRFIDGVVLEDGLETDELVAPIIALEAYARATGDWDAAVRHGEAVETLRRRLDALRDARTGLFETFQDAQDEYIKKPFSVYDNVLVWKALTALGALEAHAGDDRASKARLDEASALRTAVLRYAALSGAPGAEGPILAANVDGVFGDFADVPPGSLMKLPTLGFLSQDDPLFQRTYSWLHSPRHAYSFSGQPYGLPGSYRLPFTTSWAVADHLKLKAGRAQALKILLESPWDGGVITEGVKPDTGSPDNQGLAFATAAGYVAHTICAEFCIDKGR